MKKIIFYIIIILIFPISINAQKTLMEKIQPNHIKIQFAGNIGVISSGIGYNYLSDKAQFDILYGFIPKSLGGANIHTISNKNSILLFKQNIGKYLVLSRSVGVSVNRAFTKNTFTYLPNHYPENYYSPNAIHLAPFISYNFIYSNQLKEGLNQFNIFFEISTLDTYLYNYIRSSTVNFNEIWNLAIGSIIKLTFNNQ